MFFILGIITGLLISILIVVTLIFFKKIIQSKVDVIEKNISNHGPRPRGYVVDPLSPVDEERERIIENNNKNGVDTPISDLR